MGHQPAERGTAAVVEPHAATPATIDNPVINSPFAEPTHHFKVADGQVSGEIQDGRRPSEFLVPVAKLKPATLQAEARA